MGARAQGLRPGPVGTALLLVLLLSGCGGFVNAPLGKGNVVGRVLGADPAVARVSVHVSDDAPDEDDDGDGGVDDDGSGTSGGGGDDAEDTFVTGVDADGRFVLQGVPATVLELYVVASPTHAAFRKVRVEGGRTTDAGDITPQAGAAVRLRVVDAAGQPVPSALVRAADTLFEDVAVDASGTALLGPLPPGCYELRAQADGYEETKATHCLEAGRTLDVTLTLLDD